MKAVNLLEILKFAKKVFLKVFPQTYDTSKQNYFIFSYGAAKASPGEGLGTLV